MKPQAAQQAAQQAVQSMSASTVGLAALLQAAPDPVSAPRSAR
jgi:hypothetical protein